MRSELRRQRPSVFMMDLWATVPYYTAYLSKALLKANANLTVGSISYYLDPDCFSGRGIKVDPGLLDVVGKFRLPRLPRRVTETAGSNSESVRADGTFSRFTPRCDSCAVPANVEMASSP